MSQDDPGFDNRFDKEHTLVTAGTDSWEQAEQDARDDWLGDTTELDWFEDDAVGVPSRRGRDGASRPAAAGLGGIRGFAGMRDDAVFRRRAAAGAVLVLVLVVAVVAAVLAFGGSSKPSSPPLTPVVTSTPGTTTTAGTTTPTTPVTTPTHAVTRVVLPTSGKLQLGDTGSAVKKLQQALVKLGSGALTADGNFGTLTQRAVQAFQKAHGLAADGVVGAKTAKAINTALAAA